MVAKSLSYVEIWVTYRKSGRENIIQYSTIQYNMMKLSYKNEVKRKKKHHKYQWLQRAEERDTTDIVQESHFKKHE